MKYVIFSVLALVVVLLNSCIDGEEEVWIRGDGSARIKAVYHVPGVLFSAEDATALVKSIHDEMQKEESIKVITNRVERKEGYRVITIELETDDMMGLDEALSKNKPGEGSQKSDKMLNAILGEMHVVQDGLRVRFQRRVDLAPLLDGKSPTMLGDSEFRYIIHLPKAAESNNAHVVEDGGRTLRWIYKLGETKQKPIVLEMVAPIPLPWWVYGAGGLVVVLLVAGGVFLWRRSRQAGIAAT